MKTGYIFNFQGGSFDPDGKVPTMSQEQADAHNREVAKVECETLKKSGRGILYLVAGDRVQDHLGTISVQGCNVRRSWHNMAGKNGRTDVDFQYDGSRWHGVNIGDNQILRVRRCKK